MAQRNACKNNQQSRIHSSRYSNKKPYSTKKYGLILTIAFWLTLLTGCSTQPTSKNILAQEDKLKKIHLGQDMGEVLSIMNYEKLNYFNIKENNESFIFTEALNPKTNVRFGLFFKNKELTSLILDQDAISLFACRTRFKTNNNYWMKNGVTPYAKWIIARNKLTQEFNKKIANPTIESDRHKALETIEGAATLLIYSPFILIATPFWLADKITGESTSLENKYDKELKKEHLIRIERAKEISIGNNEKSIISKIGPPTNINYVNDIKVLTYSKLSTSYGIKNDALVLIESPSTFDLYTMPNETGDSLYGKEQCGELDNLWIDNQPSD